MLFSVFSCAANLEVKFDRNGTCYCKSVISALIKAPSTPATCRIRHVEATCRTLLQHVECCRSTCCRFWQHVERFCSSFCQTCRKKLKMFNFFRHVERTSNQFLSKKLVWTTLSTCRTFINIHTIIYQVCSFQLLHLFAAVMT